MIVGADANYAVAVLIGVSMLKLPFDSMTNKNLSNWLVRLMAVLLGGVLAVLQYWGGIDHTSGNTAYAVFSVGIKSGVLAILLYHIGSGDFIGYFDSKDPGSDTKTAVLSIPASKTAVPVSIVPAETRREDPESAVPFFGDPKDPERATAVVGRNSAIVTDQTTKLPGVV